MLRAAVFVLLWLTSPVWADGVAVPGVPPIGQSTSALAFSPLLQFYVSTSGSDTNPGTQAAPWLTVAKVNSSATTGSLVNFNGGQTFSTTTGITALVSVTSYGTGQATISSGNAAPCISETNPIFGPSVTNIVCAGGGNTSNTTHGISFTNSQTGNTKLPGPTISDVTVSGYGFNCINIEGTSGSSGFNGGGIFNSILHDCTGNSSTATGSAAIMLHAHTDYGSGVTTPAHTNFNITGVIAYNITGTSNAGNWTGSGIFLGQTGNSTVDQSVVHDFGANSNFSSSGPGGIWTGDSVNITLRRSEVYNGKHAAGGTDGGGFDCDGGTVNCIIELDYAHDNQGWDFLFDNYSDGTCCSLWGGNILRWSIGQNSQQTEMQIAISAATSGAAIIHNNTLINERGNNILTTVGEGPSVTNTLTFANNILVTFGGSGDFVNFTNTAGRNFYGNDYYAYGQAVNFSWGGTAYTSFASWQTATGQEKLNGNNVGFTSNPEIYVPGGGWTNNGYVPVNLYAYNLQNGSPMIGAGLNTQTNWGFSPGTTDYYGNAISASSLPIGAAVGDFAVFSASCSAATNFLARTSGFAKADNVNYNSLLCGEASDGDFALLDAQWMLAAPNSSAAELNTVSTNFTLSPQSYTPGGGGPPVFTARAGVQFDGLSSYYDPSYNPAVSGINYTLNAGSFGIYDFSASTPAGVTYAVGGSDVSSYSSLELFTGGGSYAFGAINSNTSTGNGVSGGISNTQGFTTVVRSSASLNTIYRNGASLGTSTDASNTLQNQTLYIGAYHSNSQGHAAFFAAGTFGSALIGGAINTANVSRRQNSFMAAYGLNVY